MTTSVTYAEDLAAYNRMKYHEYRERNLRYVTGGGIPSCAVCGATVALQFDHIDPKLKSFNVNDRKSLRDPAYREELDKCQVLCRDCHESKTAEENSGWTHGTMTGFMKKKCKCDECESSKAEYYERRNASRRSDAYSPREPYGRDSNHGERLTYRRGCRCDQCRAANAEYHRLLRGKKKN